MEPYQLRVVEEKKELDEKLVKLIDFIDHSPYYAKAAADEQALLRLQRAQMMGYSETLGLRIIVFATHDSAAKDDPANDNYPCKKCGCPRTAAQGGTTFTICDECWNKVDAWLSNSKEAPADDKHPCPQCGEPMTEAQRLALRSTVCDKCWDNVSIRAMGFKSVTFPEAAKGAPSDG